MFSDSNYILPYEMREILRIKYIHSSEQLDTDDLS